jgi:beta-mannosidase
MGSHKPQPEQNHPVNDQWKGSKMIVGKSAKTVNGVKSGLRRRGMHCAPLKQGAQYTVLIIIALAFNSLQMHRAAAQTGGAHTITIDSGWRLQDIASVHDTGTAISSIGYDAHLWYPAVVPGTVLTTLVNNHVYPEPLYGENNRTKFIPEHLSRTSYWYRTGFAVPSSFAGRHIWLNFDGINYAAEVWINGHAVGNIRGAFIRGVFDISPFVSAGKQAALAILISPQPNPGIPHEHTLARGMGKNGGLTSADGPAFLSTIGWDWLPAISDRDTGIWQRVWLSDSGPVIVKDPQVLTNVALPGLNSADITLAWTLENISELPQAGEAKIQFEGVSLRTPFNIKPHASQRITLTPNDIKELHILHPRLWWPNGYGSPSLYHLVIECNLAGVSSDTKQMEFGIRTITYSVPGSDNLTISVNGVPIFIKGGNWGLDEALKRIPRARLEAAIRMHRDAHLNLVRNWVGQSTSEDLYQLCDKYGILVWDEFFQPNPSDGPNPQDLSTYLANVRDKILRFRNHPSIALWCGRNEGEPPPQIDKALHDLTSELDPERLYQPSSTSGHGVHSSGPYGWRPANAFYAYGEAFKTEIGSVSIPTIESIHGMLPEKDWEVIDDAWAEHDFASGASSSDGYRAMIEHRYGTISNLADFVRKAQLANYEAYRAMFEGREANLFKPSTGAIIWMSNPAQPSFVWQLYHHDLEPNASYFAVKKSAEPVHVQLNELNGDVEVINNLPAALSNALVQVRIVNLDGTEVFRRNYPVTAPPSAATVATSLATPANATPVYFIKLDLQNSAKEELSSNFYWRGSHKSDNNMLELNNLPAVQVRASAKYEMINGMNRIAVTLHNSGKQVALMAHMQLRDRESMERILPAYYSDNYISLLPDETSQVTIETAESPSPLKSPAILFDGWNISLVADKSSGIALLTNVQAQPKYWPVTGLPVKWGSPSDVYRINCGGDATDGFEADNDHFGGAPSVWQGAINMNTPFAAPEVIYKTSHIGDTRYRFPMLHTAVNSTYEVRLHFAETVFSAPGKRKFNVFLNEKEVLRDFDVFSGAGGRGRALVKIFKGIAPDKDGNIIVLINNGSEGRPEIRGIEVLPENIQP